MSDKVSDKTKTMNQSPEYNYSEQPAIELFQKMGYQYAKGSQLEERTEITQILLEERLKKAIQKINPWINEINLQKAFQEISSINGSSLMEINQEAWKLIRGGSFRVKQIIEGKETYLPVHFIDYENAENNDFLVVNQLKFHGIAEHSIPDLVVFVNGLPIGIIECKSPKAQNAWDKAFSDLKYYQKNSEKLFHFNQICCGIWEVGGKYGAIEAPEQFYSVFKTAKDESLDFLGDSPKEQDILLYSLFRKERLLDLIRHFVIFELNEGKTIKKLPRYQQLRATNKTIQKLQEGEGGVVWHTQGSGKSITMAYVTRKLQAPEFGFDNPTVIIMTDRKDLDRQITTTFRNVGFKNVNQANSVAHLDGLLRNDYGTIITTTLQKFQEPDQENTTSNDQTAVEENGDIRIEKEITETTLTKIYKQKIDGKWQEIDRETIQLEKLSAKENLYILVDEAHRSHYGFLASFMRTVLPKANFIAFTGTPISKEDKSTLGEFYGGNYIDVYTIKEAVADGATVDLLYDSGIAKLSIKKEALEAEFEEKFGDASEEKKDKLKKDALKKYQISSERVESIGKHIVDHFKEKIYPDGHKAMLVCNGREAAIRYQQILHRLKEEGYHDFDSKVVVSLGSPKSDKIAREYHETMSWNIKNPNHKKPVFVVPTEDIKDVTEDFKLPFGNEEETEKSGKKKYDNTAFLIVSDMLLTGYDAPIASCLYLDKPLKEHNLLQALARVNRSRKGKNAGFIVDYSGITEDLKHAMKIFSGDVVAEDILKDLNEELPKLELNHTKLVSLFKPIKIDRNYQRDEFIDRAIRFIEPLDIRDEFKDLLKQFNKSVNLVLPNEKAMKYQSDFKLFNELKIRAKNAFPEDEELKITKDESKMLQEIIDEHLKSNGVQNLFNEPISIIDREKFEEELTNTSPATKELKMRNNLKHTIKVGIDKNPDFYKPLAERLEQLLKEKEANQITQAQLLFAFGEIQNQIINERKEGENKGFVTVQEIALFNSMKTIFAEEAEEKTRTFFDEIQAQLNIIGWESKGRVLKKIENKLMRVLKLKLEHEDAKEKMREMIDVLKKNKNA
ncbi:type I restriction endonuclease subunit R [Aureivirga marina]|uniref:type I restriction endonuclease subunit R n=1 Tax=Aureivirga marina TaxID=1182451 RepID=UPI001E375D13|nr:type I restriction endonuclease [Aureivirga marina]